MVVTFDPILCWSDSRNRLWSVLGFWQRDWVLLTLYECLCVYVCVCVISCLTRWLARGYRGRVSAPKHRQAQIKTNTADRGDAFCLFRYVVMFRAEIESAAYSKKIGDNIIDRKCCSSDWICCGLTKILGFRILRLSFTFKIIKMTSFGLSGLTKM